MASLNETIFTLLPRLGRKKSRNLILSIVLVHQKVNLNHTSSERPDRFAVYNGLYADLHNCERDAECSSEQQRERHRQARAARDSGQGRVFAGRCPESLEGSWTIANYLEQKCRDHSLFGGHVGTALTRFAESWTDTLLLPGPGPANPGRRVCASSRKGPGIFPQQPRAATGDDARSGMRGSRKQAFDKVSSLGAQPRKCNRSRPGPITQITWCSALSSKTLLSSTARGTIRSGATRTAPPFA